MFEFKKVSHDDPLLLEIFKLRYKVYCEEWGFERPEDHPGGIERDKFDQHSVHFVAIRRADQKLIGTTRIILRSELGFPIEEHCQIDGEVLRCEKTHWGEISRLAVSKDFRKRSGDDSIYKDEDPLHHELDNPFKERRKNENQIVIGLYRCIYRESLERGLTHLYAVMARGLYLLLKRIGICFSQAGPGIEYHGIRTPYTGCIKQMLEEFSQTNDALYQCFIEEKLLIPGIPASPSSSAASFCTKQ
jgi:N-acyl amino acid synthase of PEP-CTERM/exosortase system